MVERGTKSETIHDQESILTQAVVDNILENARENLVKGCLNSTLFVRFENGERRIVPLSIPGNFQEKQIYFTLLGMSFLESGHNISEAILVSEAWVVTQPDIGELEVAPSQHPNRKEAITLAGRDAANRRSVFAIQTFQRDDQNKPVFEALEVEQFDDTPDGDHCSTGLLDNLFIQ